MKRTVVVPGGFAYQRVDPQARPPATAAPVLAAEVQAVHAQVAQDPFGVEPLGFSREDVAAIGCYLQSLMFDPRFPHVQWTVMLSGRVDCFAIAIHESTEINALYRAGTDPYRQRSRTSGGIFQAAHRQAIVTEVTYWSKVAQQQGFRTSPAALEIVHYERRRWPTSHQQTLQAVLKEAGWSAPTVADCQGAEDFFRTWGLWP
jgi:hypothetical protein